MKIAIKTYGCSANTADTETITGILTNTGHQITTDTEAEIIIFNTCAVKGPTENRIISAIKQSPKNKKIIIVGCLPKISLQRLQKETQYHAIAGPSIGQDIITLVDRVAKGEKITELQTQQEKPQLTLPKINTNPLISILPINFGCLGSCAYCAVVFARGKLRSYSIPEIIQRVKADVTSGVKEFWVTSQDTAAYGKDIGKNLAELLQEISNVEGDFKVRVGMMTPNMITDMQDELIEAYKNPKIFKFLHFPIQSGDDQVLKKMRRFYTTSEFKESVAAFRTAFPSLTLATDIIVGFPGETEEDFEETLDLVKKVKYDNAFTFIYSIRKGTPAAEITEQVPDDVKHDRFNRLLKELHKSVRENNYKLKDTVVTVLVEGESKNDDSILMGRTRTGKAVNFEGPKELIGKFIDVKITNPRTFSLYGEVVVRGE